MMVVINLDHSPCSVFSVKKHDGYHSIIEISCCGLQCCIQPTTKNVD